MGETPQGVIINGYNGHDFQQFASQIPALSQMLFEHTINHQSFPVIHYFHTSDPKQSVIPAIVKLDEACELLIHNAVTSDDIQLPLRMMRTSLDAYIGMVSGSFAGETGKAEEAPMPNLLTLKVRGIPLEEDGASYFVQPQVAQRRQFFSACYAAMAGLGIRSMGMKRTRECRLRLHVQPFDLLDALALNSAPVARRCTSRDSRSSAPDQAQNPNLRSMFRLHALARHHLPPALH
jgi:hypothetical protein